MNKRTIIAAATISAIFASKAYAPPLTDDVSYGQGSQYDNPPKNPYPPTAVTVAAVLLAGWAARRPRRSSFSQPHFDKL